MDTCKNKIWKKILLPVFLLLTVCANAQDQEKFNLGGNERTETGPMLIWSGVAFGVAFVLLLIFKIRYDKKKKAEMIEKMKSEVPRTRTHSRSTASRGRGGRGVTTS